MSLITCPECGKQIPESANVCPNCGYPISSSSNQEEETKLIVKCPDCGEIIADKSNSCPNCGCPSDLFVNEYCNISTYESEITDNSNKSPRKKRKVFIPVLAIILLFIACYVTYTYVFESTMLSHWIISKFEADFPIEDCEYSINDFCKHTTHTYLCDINLKKAGVQKDYTFYVTHELLHNYYSQDYGLKSKDEIEEFVTDFIRETNLAIELLSCTSWNEVGETLSKYDASLYSKWKILDDVSDGFYSDYIYSNYNNYNRLIYNNYVSKKIEPFLKEIGADNCEMGIISNEDMQSSINSEKQYWRDGIKKARNKWVDEHPEEARRRGINKF